MRKSALSIAARVCLARSLECARTTLCHSFLYLPAARTFCICELLCVSWEKDGWPHGGAGMGDSRFFWRALMFDDENEFLFSEGRW